MLAKYLLVVSFLVTVLVEPVVPKNHRLKKDLPLPQEAFYDNPWDQQWDAPELKFEEDYHLDLQIDPQGQFHDGFYGQHEKESELEDKWAEMKKSRMESLESMTSWADCEERDTCYSSYELPFAARNCFCDPHCIIYNDCCPDSPALMEGRPAGLPNITSDRVSCQRLENVDSEAEFYVVTSCPASYRDEYVRRRCEQADVAFSDLFFKVYVSSEKSEILYRNVYCALCHGESKRLKFWQVVRNCPLQSNELLTVEPTLSSFQKLESQLKDSCKLELVPPAYVLPRKCKSHKSNCPEEWEGNREAGLCKAGSTSYVYTEKLAYKNKYCATCNGEDESKLSCKDSLSTASQFDFAFSEDAAAKPTGLWLVIDLSESLGHIRTPTHFGHPVRLGNCRETGQVFDPFRKPELCRRVRCDDDGFKYWAGKCIDKVKTSTSSSTTIAFKTGKKSPTKSRTSTLKIAQQTVPDNPPILEIPESDGKLEIKTAETVSLSTASSATPTTTTTSTTTPVPTTSTTPTTTTTEATTTTTFIPVEILKIYEEGERPEIKNEIVTTTTLSSFGQGRESIIDSYDVSVKNDELFRPAVTNSHYPAKKSTTDNEEDYHHVFETPPMRGVRKRKPSTTTPALESVFQFGHDWLTTRDARDDGWVLHVNVDEPSTISYDVMDASTPGIKFQNPVTEFSSPKANHVDPAPKGKYTSVKTKSRGKPSHQTLDCFEWYAVEDYDHKVNDNDTVFVFSLSRLFEPEEVRHVEASEPYHKDQNIEVCLRRIEISSDMKPEDSSLVGLNVTALEPLVDLLIMFHYDKPLGLTSLVLTIVALVGLAGTTVGLLSPSFVRKTITIKCILSLCSASFIGQCLYLSSSIISNLEHEEGADSSKIHMNKPAPVSGFCFWNGVLLHYFVLAGAFWMNSFVVAFARKGGSLERKKSNTEEELNLNPQAIKQKGQDGYLYYSLYAWLAPLAIVTVATIVDLTGEGSINSASIRPFYGQYKVPHKL